MLMRGAELPVQSEWGVFVIALALVGVFSLVVGLLPRTWIAKVHKRDGDDRRLFSEPLKVLGGFAAVFYFVAVVAYSAPNRWNLNPQLMFALCPMYFVKMTFDPSLVATLLLLAPLNAGVYGALGVTLGYGWMAFSKRS
jgi:hypothetical protein